MPFGQFSRSPKAPLTALCENKIMLTFVLVFFLTSFWPAVVCATAERRCNHLKGVDNHGLMNIAGIDMANFMHYGLGLVRVVATRYVYIGHSLDEKHSQHNSCWSTPADPLPLNICRVVMSVTSPMLTEPLRAELWLPDNNNGQISFIDNPDFEGCEFVQAVGHLTSLLTAIKVSTTAPCWTAL